MSSKMLANRVESGAGRDRFRAYRLAAAGVAASLLAFGAGPMIGGIWLLTALAFEGATWLRRSVPLEKGRAAALALVGLSNVAWAAAPIALWLCAPHLAPAAGIWLGALLAYHATLHRHSTAFLAVNAAPHVLGFLAIAAFATAPDARAMSVVLAIVFMALLALVARRHTKTAATISAAQIQLAERTHAAETSAARLKYALDNLGAAVVEIDYGSRTVIGHESMTPLIGKEMAPEDVFNARAINMHPEDRAGANEAVRRALKTGGKFEFEHRILHPARGERWLRVSGFAAKGENGRPGRVTLMHCDVTEHKLLGLGFEAAMRRAESSLLGKRALMERIAGDVGLPTAHPAAHDGEAGGAPYGQLDRILAEIDARDEVISRSIEALRLAREQADAANAAKTQFLATMSHELRTPLNAVIGYAELLEEDLSTANMAPAARDATRIRAAAHTLLRLINDVLDLSKIEAGKTEILVEPIYLGLLLQEVSDIARPLAAARNNNFEISIDGELGVLRNDAAKLRQCLLNLVSNACKFCENGNVAIRVSRVEADDEVLLQFDVSDSGIGMDSEQLQRIFRPFTQADATTTRRFGGTGLGLSITRHLAELMGGDLTVTSQPAQGSTFTLTVAAALDEDDDSGESENFVLVVDDQISCRRLISRLLGRLGYPMRSAATAAAGQELATRLAPALIILDIRLPDRSGWEVLQHLKTDPATAAIPVLVVSADDDRARAISLGACDLFTKPINRPQLTAAVMRYARPRMEQAAAQTTPPALGKASA